MEETQLDSGLCSNSPSNVHISLDFRADPRPKSQPITLSIDLKANSANRLPSKAPTIIRHQRAFSYDLVTPCLERSSTIHHCYICCENFINSHELKEHKLRNCRPKFTCETCSKSFNEITHYINHIRQHTEDSHREIAESSSPHSPIASQRLNGRSSNSYSCRICRDSPVIRRSAQRIHRLDRCEICDYSSNDEN